MCNAICPKGDPNFHLSSVKVFAAVGTMLSMRAVTLLTLWFSLVSLMPAEKHLLIETGDDLVKGEADQNKAWKGGWPSAEKGMTNKAQKVNKLTRWTWYK